MVHTDLASPLLANERSFLAWTRTCLALVGAGLVAAKFFGGRAGAVIASACFVLASIFLGFAAYRYFHVIALLEAGTFDVDNMGPAVVVGTVLLSIAAGSVYTWRFQIPAQAEAAAGQDPLLARPNRGFSLVG